MTCIALANTFFNPDLLVAAEKTTDGGSGSVSLVGTQVARFTVIALSIIIPMTVLLVFAPQKDGYRWKLPLKTFIDIVSLGMLALNAFSWSVRGETLTSPKVPPPWRATSLFDNSSTSSTTDDATLPDVETELESELAAVNDVLAYGVLVASWLLLLTFAAFFVIFVVFRGAKLQKRQEEAQEALDVEDGVVDALRLHINTRTQQRALVAWRDAAKAGRTRDDAGGTPRRSIAVSFQQERSIRRLSSRAAGAHRRRRTRGATGTRSRTLLQRILVDPIAEAVAAVRGEPANGGWTEHWSDMHSQTYWHRASTNETTWERPAELGPDPNHASIEMMQTTRRRAAPTDEELTAASLSLPPGWSAHVNDATGAAYYHNRATGETQWTLPATATDDELAASLSLPPGWSAHVNDATGATYYHNSATGETSWERPQAAKATAIGSTEAMRVNPLAQTAEDESSSSSSSTMSSATDEEEEEEMVHHHHHQKPKFVRWKFTPRDDTTLADALLGSAGATRFGGARRQGYRDGVPAYLVELFDAIFEDADKSGSGTLSTLDFMFMLQKRAKGTALDGNAHAIFKLKQLLASQSEDSAGRRDSSGLGKIGKIEFTRGLFAAMRNDPNGACGQWLLLEMMDAVDLWEEHEHRDDGTGEVRSFYVHTETGVKSWKKPPLLVELARITAMLQRARPLS